MKNAEKAIKELGLVIKKQRKKKRLSKTQLALIAGVSLNFISQIEAGKSRAQLVKVMHILNILGLQLRLGVGRELLVPDKHFLTEDDGE